MSIVLPTFNGSKHLVSSIESCLRQSHSNLELIVVDDGSGNETQEILQGFTDDRMLVICQEMNRGLPTALNTGFARATGTFLTWTSDDNEYTTDALESLVGFLQRHPDVDFVYADFLEIDWQGEILRRVRVGDPEELHYHNCVSCCFMFRREVFEVIGDFNPRARLAEDSEYWLRVFQRFRMAPYRERPLYRYRKHAGSLSGSGYLAYEAIRVEAKHRRRILRNGWLRYAHRMSQAYTEEAFARYANQDLTGAWKCMVRGVSLNPSRLANRGVLSILVRSLLSQLTQSGAGTNLP